MNLRDKRVSLGITTKGAAKRMGVSTRQLNRIESKLCKKPMSCEKAIILANIYGCNVAEIRLLEGFYDKGICQDTKEHTGRTGEEK